MKHFLKAGIVMLALFGFTAAAQDWYHDREERFRGEEWRGHLFEHVRVDLDHVGSAVFAAPREQHRLQRTKQELADLQGKLQAGRFDDHELSDVIDSLVKSANDQRLAPRDRDVLNDDLNRLRDYRAHHDNWRR
jgi:hypothetical protein